MSVNVINEVPRITGIFLSNLGLEGQLPFQYGQLRQLTILNLDGNNYSGSVPYEISSLPNLFFLNLAGNALTGSIPVPSSRTIYILELSNNQFSGSIPGSLGTKASLRLLELSNNNLTGTIHSELTQLADTLSTLRIAGNNFSGCVPHAIALALGQIPNHDLGRLNIQVCYADIIESPGHAANCFSLVSWSSGRGVSETVRLTSPSGYDHEFHVESYGSNGVLLSRQCLQARFVGVSTPGAQRLEWGGTVHYVPPRFFTLSLSEITNLNLSSFRASLNNDLPAGADSQVLSVDTSCTQCRGGNA